MKKYSFKNDYSEGACSEVMEALERTNRIQTAGYGEDPYCQRAKELIRKEAQSPEADIYFIPGGTQTNMLMISAALRPFEAVVAAESGHINVHETGAVEATGHKILTVAAKDGKLTPQLVESVVGKHNDHHMVKPKMVYISNSTEVGTVYCREELKALSLYCRSRGMYLFLDGARLGAALCSRKNDMTMVDIADLTDCFYIGGTKNGILFGEALVLTNPVLKTDFQYQIKQRGALLAKGRLLGVQFEALFTNGLFYRLASHADQAAMQMKEGMAAMGCRFYTDACANQLFPILEKRVFRELLREYDCELIEELDADHVVVRLTASWATPKEAVKEFLKDLKGYLEP